MGRVTDIVRVTEDHGTLYARLSRSWASREGMRRGSYLCVEEVPGGGLLMVPFDRRVKGGKRTKKHKGG